MRTIQKKAVVKDSGIFVALFAREEALLCGAHQSRVSKGFIHQGGNGSEGYWSVQMALTVWWGLSKSGRERKKQGARITKDTHHPHTLQNAFLLSCFPGMGGRRGELGAHPPSYQSAPSTRSHLRKTPLPQYHAVPITQILGFTNIWNGWSTLGRLKVQHLSAATAQQQHKRIPGTVPGNKRPGQLTARKYEDSEYNLESRWLNSTIEINRYQDQLWKAIIQSWGMMDLIYRRRIQFKRYSRLNVATVMLWKGFSRHCEHLIESIMRCLWTFSYHFTMVIVNLQEKSLKRWAATAQKMWFSPAVETFTTPDLFWKTTYIQGSFLCFSTSHSGECSKIVKKRSVCGRRAFQVGQTVSQHGPADTVSGCAAVMSAHETRRGTKHSWFWV